MKILTTNFLTCAVRTCKSSNKSFPLHFHDATLARTEIAFQPAFIRNILPRIDYDAVLTTATELSLQGLVPEREVVEKIAEGNRPALRPDEEKDRDEEEEKGEAMSDEDDEAVLKKLHTLLLETSVQEGKLVCGNCGFEYPIKEGVGNFLLPAHLV